MVSRGCTYYQLSGPCLRRVARGVDPMSEDLPGYCTADCIRENDVRGDGGEIDDHCGSGSAGGASHCPQNYIPGFKSSANRVPRPGRPVPPAHLYQARIQGFACGAGYFSAPTFARQPPDFFTVSKHTD